MLKRKPYLRPLLILLSIGGVLLTSALLLSTMLIFQKNSIENSLLDNNLAYARKLADTTDRYLDFAQRELAWSTSQIHSTDPVVIKNELESLNSRSGIFNSLVMVDAQDILVMSYPSLPSRIGMKVHSKMSKQMLTARQPMISQPFISTVGNLMIMLINPIQTSEGRYLGFIGGSIYLKKHNMLSDILSLHFFGKNISITIVDNDGRIIYDPTSGHTGSLIPLPSQVKEALHKNENGYFIGHDGSKENLVGYANLTKTDWNIFVSTPADTITDMLQQTLEKISGMVLTILLLVAAGMAFISSRIARPLEQLAKYVTATDNSTIPEKLSTIRVWYQEAALLRNALEKNLRSVSVRLAVLSDEALTDPLTGLLNRRGFNEQSSQINNSKVLSLIAVDIDYFKKINDRFGHDIGDKVLVQIADLLKLTCRESDIISRFGGEEFIVLLPDTPLSSAIVIAERIRRVIAAAEFPKSSNITISAGVAGRQEYGCDLDLLLRNADAALYQAKLQGRNRVVISE